MLRSGRSTGDSKYLPQTELPWLGIQKVGLFCKLAGAAFGAALCLLVYSKLDSCLFAEGAGSGAVNERRA